MDTRTPRDGRVIEELGHYDPMVRDVDARTVLNAERIEYWLGVGALPTPKVGVLIRKYGTGGTHVEQNKTALERLKEARKATGPVAPPPPAKEKPKKQEEPAAEETPAEEAAAEGTLSDETGAEASTEAPEAAAAEEGNE
jgi:small subunit ribosomal protein S16